MVRMFCSRFIVTRLVVGVSVSLRKSLFPYSLYRSDVSQIFCNDKLLYS
jgi:hypothetical protein